MKPLFLTAFLLASSAHAASLHTLEEVCQRYETLSPTTYHNGTPSAPAVYIAPRVEVVARSSLSTTRQNWHAAGLLNGNRLLAARSAFSDGSVMIFIPKEYLRTSMCEAVLRVELQGAKTGRDPGRGAAHSYAADPHALDHVGAAGLPQVAR